MSLIDSLIKDGWLKTDRIIKAFGKIKREDFLPDDVKKFAEWNEALPIGYGQTISQPLTVAFMLELLQPKGGEKILDVGSGSGWTSALLAHIVSGGELKSKIKDQRSKMHGRVISIEIVPELKKFGEKNVSKYSFLEKGTVKYVLGDGSKGYKEESPYDKILAGASGSDLPAAWKEQLKVGGKIVCPIESSVWLFVKKPKQEFAAPQKRGETRSKKSFEWESTEYPGFAFVPLISK